MATSVSFLNRAIYLWRETFLGMTRGGWMNWAAISTVTVLLFLFGISLQTSWQIDRLINSVGSKVEIAVYLEPQVVGKEFLPEVENLPTVNSVTLISRDEAWENLLADLDVLAVEEATEQLDGNPLVDELRVRVSQVDFVHETVAQLENLPGVGQVVYFQDALKRLEMVRQGVVWVSFSLTFILSLTAIAVIMTTLRLIATARSQEIEIMRLVGATTAWIYLPFIFQGVSFGLAGGMVAWIFITSLRQSFQGIFQDSADLLQALSEGFSLTWQQNLSLSLMILAIGAAIGLLGSLFALNRIVQR